MVESLLPLLDSKSEGYESSKRCASLAEVFMATTANGAPNDGTNIEAMNRVLTTPITSTFDVEKAMEEARLTLQAEKSFG